LTAEEGLAAFLHEQGLAAASEPGIWTPLSGGVSSDIWHVATSRGDFCVKRALAKLKVSDDWQAPVERNAFEWAYMEVAARIAPGAVPQPLAHDPGRGLFAMAWLAPDRHPLWKEELLAGRVDPDFAAAVGDLVGRIHAGTAKDPSIPDNFATDATFFALRIDAYLLATADRHPNLAVRIRDLAKITATTRYALVHGDVSPKNILVGPDGPVLLDAEVAWFGDPAFDLAFCLNHLAIKARILPENRQVLLESFDAFAGAYLARVDWEAAGDLEGRAARLLPALALARVDGKSPVEYLDDARRASLRAAACGAMLAGDDRLTPVRDALTAP
jgi:fructosamine-3-kinase